MGQHVENEDGKRMKRREERCDCCSLAVVVARADMVVVVVVLLAGSRMTKLECFGWSELQPQVSTATLTLTFLTLIRTIPNTFFFHFSFFVRLTLFPILEIYTMIQGKNTHPATPQSSLCIMHTITILEYRANKKI